MRQRLIAFVDRDGVINRRLDLGVRTPAELELLPGALEALAMLARHDARVIVVTNQANVGRGFLPLERLHEIHAALLDMIRAAGGRVEAVYVCPHAPEDGCRCRKPAPGMLQRAASDLGFAMRRAYMIGDQPTDVEAAHRAGCRAVLVGSDDGISQCRPHLRAASLLEAAHQLLTRSAPVAAAPPSRGETPAWALP